MKNFRDLDALDEWLEPMDYPGFWFALSPYIERYDLDLQPKDHCDQQIREGAVDEACVLDVLKGFARIEIGQAQDLHWRARPRGCVSLNEILMNRVPLARVL